MHGKKKLSHSPWPVEHNRKKQSWSWPRANLGRTFPYLQTEELPQRMLMKLTWSLTILGFQVSREMCALRKTWYPELLLFLLVVLFPDSSSASSLKFSLQKGITRILHFRKSCFQLQVCKGDRQERPKWMAKTTVGENMPWMPPSKTEVQNRSRSNILFHFRIHIQIMGWV